MANSNQKIVRTSKRLDKMFLPTFIITFVAYFIIFYLVISIDTKGPDLEEVKKRNIKKAARILVKAEEKEKKEIKEKKQDLLRDKGDDKNLTEEQQEVQEVTKTISNEAKKVVRKSAKQRRAERSARKAKRAKAKAARRSAAKARASARLQKIKAKGRGIGAGSASSKAYESFKGTKGGDLAGKLAKSGGVGVGGRGGSGGGSGIGRASGGGLGIGTGGIDDFLEGGDYGDVGSVEGVDEFTVTPLKLKKGSKKSSRDLGSVQGIVSKKSKGLQKCIKRARSKFNTLSGNLLYQFTIKANGRVSRVRITKSSWNNKKYGKIVEKCIIKAIKGWRFGKVSKGNVTIEQVMVF